MQNISRTLKHTKYGKKDTPFNSESMRWQWYGWCDVQDGIGFRKEYDTVSEPLQRNYEMGRALATAIKKEWGVVLDWKPGMQMTESRKFEEAWQDGEVRAIWKETKAYHFAGVARG